MEQYSREEILNIVEEEDVEFIRLQFTDMFGTMKNIAIPAGKLPKAMDDRCIIDASSIEGFIRTEESEMYLSPDLTTFSILPWRPQQGKGCETDLRSDTHGRNSLRGKPQIPPQRGSEKGGKPGLYAESE